MLLFVLNYNDYLFIMNADITTPKYVIDLARDLRKNMTLSEKILWQKLKNKQIAGFRFRKQHPIYRYVLDFYCFEKMLAVEIDGNAHIGREEYDEFRDEVMISIGIETLRFNDNEVLNNMESVLRRIKETLDIRFE